MKKRTMLIVLMLLLICVVCSLTIFVACDNGHKDDEVYAIYSLYVAEAKAADKTPLSYEAWLASIRGADGRDGKDGTNGVDGKSAYEIWLQNGHTGTQADFLEWLKGVDGKDGTNGKDGANGENGTNGKDGVDGKSDYQIWLDNGHDGTEKDFLDWLKGSDGVGIVKIEKTATDGLVDTYTIFLSNNTTTTFTVTNGGEGTALHEHDWQPYCVLEAATCQQSGKELVVCSQCSLIKAVTTPKTNHDYEIEVTPANCTENGYTTYTCKFCHYQYNDDIVQANGTHMFEGAKCLFCNQNVAVLAVSVQDVSAANDNSVRAYVVPRHDGKVDVVVLGSGAMRDGGPLDGECVIANEFRTRIVTAYIDDGITVIGCVAFDGCTALTRVVLPNSVTHINYWAFRDCRSLSDIKMPTSIEYLDGEAFMGCSALPYIEYDNALYLGSSSNDYFLLAKAKNSSIITCTISPDAQVIACGAFSRCTSLKSIVIPDNLHKMQSEVFYECTGLQSVTLMAVFKIGRHSFYGCTSLKNVTLPEGLLEIGDRAFDGCTMLTSINLPSTVEVLGEYAFQGCGLRSIYIPEGVKVISAGLFSCCSSLEAISLPSGTTSIGPSAFYECSELKSITIPQDVTEIGARAFCNCFALEQIFFNATNCSNCTDSSQTFAYAGTSGKGIVVSVAANVQSIPAYIFRGATDYTGNSYAPKITTVVFAANSQCTSIGACAFWGCSTLTSINTPAGASVGRSAFDGCSLS